MRVKLFTLLVLLGTAVVLWGQAGDARGTATGSIGGKQVVIEYGRPALKGRNFADMTKKLPGDRIWRAGAGEVTTFSTEAALVLGGKVVPPGKYSLYIHCPDSGGYSLVLNRDLGQPLGKIWAAAPAALANQPYPRFEYAKEVGDKEVARAPLKMTNVTAVEVLTYSFAPAGNGATLTLSWGEQAWSVEIQPK